MSNVLKLKFTNEELNFMKSKGFDASNNLDVDLAEKIVDNLGYEDYGIAADIITKITTHPEW